MILETIDPAYVKYLLETNQLLVNTLTSFISRLTFDDSNRLAIQNPPNLDVALSTRASESTLSGIKTQTDKLTFDTSNYLQVNVKATVNPSNLDVALSTRASESTLSGLSGKFPSATALADNLANPTTTIVGAANLGWDGTYWRRLVVDTSSRLRTVVESVTNPPNLDVALSTRASESTLSAIKNALASVGTDKMRVSVVDSLPAGTNKIGSVDVASLPNPSNLDVALSTRASESTLSGLSGKFPSAVALSDSLSNPTTTIVGDALLGFDGTNWRRVRVDTSGRLAIQNQPNLDVALSTATVLTRFGRSISVGWVIGSETTAPAAGTALVSKSVTSGKTGYIYGFVITAGEANDFKINWTSGGIARSVRIATAARGSVVLISPTPVNEGLGANGGMTISITNVNAGSSGVVYQAALLYGEV